MKDIIKFKKEIKDIQPEIDLRESAPGPRKSVDKIPYKSVSSPRESAIEWQAPAFKYYPKDVSWYWMSFIIAILLMAFAVLQKNFLFAVFIFLAEISVLILARRQPETLKFKIDDKGITIIDKIYQFGDLEKFCLRPDNEDKKFEELVLKKKTHFNPYLKISVDIKVASQVRDILSQKLTEEEYEDSLLELIFKWLRF